MSTSGGQNTLARVKERNVQCSTLHGRRSVAATIYFGGGWRFKARFCGWRENVSPSPRALAVVVVHRAAAARSKVPDVIKKAIYRIARSVPVGYFWDGRFY